MTFSAAMLSSSPALAITAKITAHQWESAPGFERRLELSYNNATVRMLLNPSYVTANTSIQLNDAQTVAHPNSSFTGVIEGEDDSWVRMNLSKTRLNGVFSKDGDRFKVSTDRYGAINVAPLADNHEQPGSQGSRIRSVASLTQTPVTRIANIAIVVDSQYNERFGGEGVDKALSIINAVDGIYREEFALGLKVSKIINVVDKNSDPFKYGPVPIEQMLRNFREYRRSSEYLSDVSLVHLFTGNTNTDEPVGLAWIDTACRKDGYDVGISTPYRHDILLAAHEIAHNLGAQHDSETACVAERDKVMWPYISSNTSQYFSSCTYESVMRSLQNSCHASTIDLQVSLLKSDNDTISATIRNNDLQRVNGSAVLSIDFPENSIATALEGSCIQPDNTLECDIGTLLPGAEETIIVQLDHVDEDYPNISAVIDNEESADPYPSNNQMSIDMVSGLVSSFNTSSTATPFAVGGNAGADQSGVGSVSPLALLSIIMIAAARRR